MPSEKKTVIGRDDDVNAIWKILQMESITMTAERRIGKTMILKKLAREHPEEWVVCFTDLEKIHSPTAFAESLVASVHDYISTMDKVDEYWKKIQSRIPDINVEMFGAKAKLSQENDKEIDWRVVIEQVLISAADTQNSNNKKLLLLLDEFPYMLQKFNNDHPGSLSLIHI